MNNATNINGKATPYIYEETHMMPDSLPLLRFKPDADIGHGGHDAAPEECAVFLIPERGYGGVIVYAKYRGEWHANTGERYVIRHLLAKSLALEGLSL